MRGLKSGSKEDTPKGVSVGWFIYLEVQYLQEVRVNLWEVRVKGPHLAPARLL